MQQKVGRAALDARNKKVCWK